MSVEEIETEEGNFEIGETRTWAGGVGIFLFCCASPLSLRENFCLHNYLPVSFLNEGISLISAIIVSNK